ncbi:exopolysaccharide biosynthesis protein [Mesorhizobium sp. M0998]
MFLLAVVIALLIPFGNILPVLSLVVLAVALMECDGLVTLIGLLLARRRLSRLRLCLLLWHQRSRRPKRGIARSRTRRQALSPRPAAH